MPVPSKSELFELIVDSSTDFAIFTVNAVGMTTSWNVDAERVFGYSAEEMLGRSADIVFTPEDRDGRAPERERAGALEQVGRLTSVGISAKTGHCFGVRAS